MTNPSRPSIHPIARPLTMAQLQRLKNWHLAERRAHPVEHEVWNAVMVVWLMGWIGGVPAWAFDAPWAFPLCLLGVLAPQLYVHWRARAQAASRIRCDWLALLS